MLDWLHSGATLQIEDEIMPTILRKNKKMQSMIANDELSDVSPIAGAQIGKHYEIAAYGTAAAYAKLLRRQEDLQFLVQPLRGGEAHRRAPDPDR